MGKENGQRLTTKSLVRAVHHLYSATTDVDVGQTSLEEKMYQDLHVPHCCVLGSLLVHDEDSIVCLQSKV